MKVEIVVGVEAVLVDTSLDHALCEFAVWSAEPCEGVVRIEDVGQQSDRQLFWRDVIHGIRSDKVRKSRKPSDTLVDVPTKILKLSKPPKPNSGFQPEIRVSASRQVAKVNENIPIPNANSFQKESSLHLSL